MADSNSIFGNSKNKVIETQNLTVRGHLLRWSDTAIQISNISMVTTAPLPAPAFPVLAILEIIVGLVLTSKRFSNYYDDSLSTIQLVGITLVFAAVVWIALWFIAHGGAKDKKYLHFVLNSGNVYSFIFDNPNFLKQVLQVFANIFENGTTPQTNYHINVKECEIRDNASVIHVTEEAGL